LRAPAIEILISILRGEPAPNDDALYDQFLKGINLERPFAEHRRPFPVVERIEPEQALWLLGCLAVERTEVPEEAVVGYLTSDNWRERIDAAVLLDRLGFGSVSAETLAVEADKPYAFSEIMGIGKSHYDENFRDKCYMVMALAHHAPNVQRLRTFSDPRSRYRDVRFGLAIGLGKRGTPDGIELLVEMASRDPIAVIRREARASLRAVQEREQMANRSMPTVRLPQPLPFEALFPPRGLEWPSPAVEAAPTITSSPEPSLADLQAQVAAGLSKERYRDLNNANNQAPGAKRMMVRDIDDFDRAVEALGARYPQQAASAARQLLDSPYPVAHFLALREISAGSRAASDDHLLERLDAFAASADTVGFYWTCDALASRRVEAAIPALLRHAERHDPPNIHGPAGMGLGYPAAKAVARLAGRCDHAAVRRLLAGDNVWLRAGAVAGLSEARAPRLANLLKTLLRQPQPAILHDHARVGLDQLGETREACHVR
jgi:hypothetical protein